MVDADDELHGDIKYTVEDSIAELHLDRPDAFNCIREETLYDLDIARQRAEEDDDVRGILIRSTGDDSFSTGGDLDAVIEFTESAEKGEWWLELWHQVFMDLHRTDLPVVGAVVGQALAGGLEIVMACDIVVSAPHSRFGDQHLNYNLIPGGTGSQVLPRLVGRRRAKELILTGKTIDADTACEWGLVNEVSEDALDDAWELAEAITDKHPEALRRAKNLIDKGLDAPLDTALALEREMTAVHLDSDAAKAGLEQFQNR